MLPFSDYREGTVRISCAGPWLAPMEGEYGDQEGHGKGAALSGALGKRPTHTISRNMTAHSKFSRRFPPSLAAV